MARTTATEPANRAPATTVAATTAPGAQTDGVSGTVQAAPASSTTGADGAAAPITISGNPSAGVQGETGTVADEKGELTIYPLRSYLDGNEVRRAGGKGYKSPKHDAVALIAAGLASAEAPKE